VLVLNLQAALARWLARRPATDAARPSPATSSRRRPGRPAPRVLGLTVLAWPGWLSPGPENPAATRRVDFRVDPDPTLERLAGRLDAWYAARSADRGRPPVRRPAGRGHYCAWFCPRAKGFLDVRLGLFRRPWAGTTSGCGACWRRWPTRRRSAATR